MGGIHRRVGPEGSKRQDVSDPAGPHVVLNASVSPWPVAKVPGAEDPFRGSRGSLIAGRSPRPSSITVADVPALPGGSSRTGPNLGGQENGTLVSRWRTSCAHEAAVEPEVARACVCMVSRYRFPLPNRLRCRRPRFNFYGCRHRFYVYEATRVPSTTASSWCRRGSARVVRSCSRVSDETARLSFHNERPAMAPPAPFATAISTCLMNVSWSTPAESTAHGTPAAASVTAALASADPGYWSLRTFAPHSTERRAASATRRGNAAA